MFESHKALCKKYIEIDGRKMDEYRENTTVDKREEIKRKLRQYYDGRIVRKDLTKSIP